MCIVGLPGSGKTTFARKTYPAIRIIEDWHSKFDLEQIHMDTVLDSVMLTRVDFQDRLIAFFDKPGFQLDWIFFENDPEACIANATTRDKPVSPTTIRMMSKTYRILEGYPVIPVYRS